MHRSRFKYTRIPHWGFVFSTILLSIVLSVLPLPGWLQNAWPDWINLVVFYWAIALPTYLGFLFGCSCGILQDIASFSLLGQHALGKALSGMVGAAVSERFKFFNFIERMATIFVLQSVNIAIVSSTNLLAFDTPIQAALWQSALTTSLMWPLVSIALDQFDPNLN